MKLKLKDIRLDGGTQPREFINQDVVNEYADEMVESDNFPPMIVFNDGANYWLADGFHRYFANKKAGFVEVNCDVRTGTMRDAVLFSVSANAVHGLRRTNDDKRKAVMVLLEDLEWSEWSDKEIARRCNVSAMTVGRIKKSLSLETTEVKYTDKHGNTSTMKKPEVVNLKPLEKMVEPEDDKLQELAVANQDLAEENAKLLDRLALQNMAGSEEEKNAAAETIAELRAQVKALEAELRAVKVSRDQLQSTNAEMVKQLSYWKRRAEKAA